MVGIRRFPDLIERIARSWFERVVSNTPWKFLEQVGEGEFGAWHVISDDGLKGFAKQAECSGVRCAVNEKLASDLAFLLNLPVPPVTTIRRSEDENFYTVSLRPFAKTMSVAAKRRLSPTTADDILGACADVLAAGYVFHNWIGDTDHNGNEGNIVFDDDGDLACLPLAFIDHSLSCTWGLQDPPNTLEKLQESYYGLRVEDMQAAVIMKTLQGIVNLQERQIAELVTRFLDGQLPNYEKQRLYRYLIERRKRLVKLIYAKVGPETIC